MPQDRVFSSLAELKAHLAALPPPKPGLRRVFRGQTHDFGKMIPSGIRRRTREYWSLWHRHAMLVSKFEPDVQAAAARLEPSTLDMLAYWVHAIAQHYGGDSSYLDVTHDIESALWFALHEMKPVPVKIGMGTGDTPDPAHDVMIELGFWKYEPWTKEPAWLYVFDVPVWTQGSSLDHGVLIDIAEHAPALITASTRMAAQRACLLHASSADGNLAELYACPPLRVAWPMTGATRLNSTTSDIFPPPARDPWYRIFCNLPLGPTVSAGGEVRLDRPLPVAQYVPSNQAEVNDVLGRISLTSPTLARNAMLEAMRDGQAPQRTVEQLENAPVILLEAALMALLPSTHGNRWNLPLLLDALPERVSVTDFKGASLGEIPTNNLFFEFSAMEARAVESARGAAPPEYPRGLWLIRKEGRIGAALYMHRENGGGYALPPLAVGITPGGDMELRAGDTVLPPAMTHGLMGPICVALFALSWLRDGEKMLPFAAATFDAELPTGTHLSGYDGLAVTLKRVNTPIEGVTVHVLRQGNEVFCGPAMSKHQFATPADRPYGRFTLDELRRYGK
ncbi:MAG: FRG domain-containing protein [Planctomycetes bacterium]|nr:FRG domain-containing protein [Planctomycetota bacterium]